MHVSLWLFFLSNIHISQLDPTADRLPDIAGASVKTTLRKVVMVLIAFHVSYFNDVNKVVLKIVPRINPDSVTEAKLRKEAERNGKIFISVDRYF